MSRTIDPRSTNDHRRSPGGSGRPAPGEPPERSLRICGLPAVAALFRRDPQRVSRLYYEDAVRHAAGEYCATLARLHRPYRLVDSDELTQIAGTPLHGGIVAVAAPQPLPDLDPDAALAWALERRPLVVLDGVGNPHNLGAIARTLAFFGLRRLVLSDRPSQALPSDAAYRVAEGGLDALDLYRARRLPALLRPLRAGYRVLGAALERGVAIDRLPPDRRPPLLLLGNEEQGLERSVLDLCETVVTIPGSGRMQSLNVSNAAAILVYALTRKR